MQERINYEPIANLMQDYLLSLSECKHGNKPSLCYVCIAPAKNNPRKWGYSPEHNMEENQFFLDQDMERRDEWLRKFKRKAMQEKLYGQDKFGNTYEKDRITMLPAADGQTVTAQSFSRRPLRFGGDDRVLSDQHKFGSRAERASQKHHETDAKGETKLHKFYGAAEQVYDKSKPVYTNKLVGNRIRSKFVGHYNPAPDETPIPKGDHYMER